MIVDFFPNVFVALTLAFTVFVYISPLYGFYLLSKNELRFTNSRILLGRPVKIMGILLICFGVLPWLFVFLLPFLATMSAFQNIGQSIIQSLFIISGMGIGMTFMYMLFHASRTKSNYAQATRPLFSKNFYLVLLLLFLYLAFVFGRIWLSL